MTTRMTRSESVMWTVEKDPSLRSDFLNLTLLDRPPDLDRLKAKMISAIDVLPRLRQRVVTAPFRLVPPEWVDDARFDLDYHVRHVAVPSPGTRRQLLDLAATFAMAPFDRARPLWELVVMEGLEGGQGALLQKIHHTIIDGVGGVKFSMALLDLERDPADVADAPEARPALPPGDRRTPADVAVRAVADLVRGQVAGTRAAVGQAAGLATAPSRLLQLPGQAARTARSVVDQAFVQGAALSPLMTERSVSRRFETHSVPLDDAKRVAKDLGGTVNDLFVTGVAGGFGLYHERMGHPVEALRMAMPVNLRSDDEGYAGNRFAPARVVVPVVPKDPAERFAAVRARLRGIRSEPAFDLVEPLAALVGLLPTSMVVPLMRSQTRTIDFVCSNVRGAPFDLYLGGARVESNHPMGPCTGCAANVTTLSYRGQLDMGINLDPTAVGDPEALHDCLTESFDDLLALAR